MNESTQSNKVDPMHIEMTLAINKTGTKEVAIQNASGRLVVYVVAPDAGEDHDVKAAIIGAAPPSTLLVVLDALASLQQSIVKACPMAALPWMINQMKVLRENPLDKLLSQDPSGQSLVDIPKDDPFGQAVASMFQEATDQAKKRPDDTSDPTEPTK